MGSMKPIEWAMLVLLSIFWGGAFFFVEAGILIGFFGVYLMMSPEFQKGISWRGLGLIAVIGAAVSYSLAGIFGKRFKSESPIVTSAGMGGIFLGLIVIDGRVFRIIEDRINKGKR